MIGKRRRYEKEYFAHCEGKLNGCNGEILVPAYDLDIVLHEGRNTVNFTPGEAGIVPFSCWMGMIKSSINVVD